MKKTNQDYIHEPMTPLKNPRKALWKEIVENKYLYLLLLPGVIYFIIFCYMPMAGLQIAFKDYNAKLGIWGSHWNNFAHFIKLFSTPDFINVFKNTLIIAFGRLVVEFWFPIFLAILLNELCLSKLKKVYQTIFTFPYFLSWVVVGSILTTFLGSNGPANYLIQKLGGDSVNFLSNKDSFRWLLYLTDMWKNSGWTCIIYIAALAGVNQDLYEAANVDGASRMQRILHISLPGIKNTIIIMFILQVGQTMTAGFNQVFNMYNPAVYSTGDIIDTYIYRISFLQAPDYGYSTAAGLFKSVINLILILVANGISKKFTDDGKGALI